MSIRIIKERTVKTETWFEHNFKWANTPGWAGFSFTLNDKKEPVLMGDEALKNYRLCLAGKMVDHTGNGDYIIDEGITRRERRYTENATGRCRCGTVIELYDQYLGACECPNCGQWYNIMGQELIPPQYWEDDGGDGDYGPQDW